MRLLMARYEVLRLGARGPSTSVDWRFLNLQNEHMPGLLRLIFAYLDTLEMTEPERVKIGHYLDLVRRRANGKLIPFLSVPRYQNLECDFDFFVFVFTVIVVGGGDGKCADGEEDFAP